jgi:hypothetical protein
MIEPRSKRPACPSVALRLNGYLAVGAARKDLHGLVSTPAFFGQQGEKTRSNVAFPVHL